MTAVCMNPSVDRHEIPDGSRRLDLTFNIDWGTDDLRDPHGKPLVFCSFGCLAQWAEDRADQHDTHTLTEGAAG